MMHHHRRNRRRGLAYLLTGMILLPLLGAPLQMALATDTTSSGTLKRNDTALKNDDIVLLSDTLAWEQSVDFAVANEVAIDLPQGLTVLEDSEATLKGSTNTYSIKMDVVGQKITVKEPNGTVKTPVQSLTNALPPVQPEVSEPEAGEPAQPEASTPEQSELEQTPQQEEPDVSTPVQSEPEQPAVTPPQEEPEQNNPQTPPQADPEQEAGPVAPSVPEPAPEPEQPEAPGAPAEPSAGIDPEALFSAAFFSLVPHAAAAGDSYTLSVPCKINESKVSEDDNTITIGNPKILELKVPAVPTEAPTIGLFKDLKGTQPLQENGETLSLNTPLYLRLYWENLGWIKTGTEYSIRLPSPLISSAAAQEGVIPVSNALDEDGKLLKPQPNIASWNVAEGSDILHITFNQQEFYMKDETGALQKLDTKDVLDAYFTFESRLDEDQLSKGDGAETIFTLPGDKTYHVTINDWKPKAPKLEKKAGAFDDKGVVTWTVQYTTASSTFDKAGVPVKLVDTLPDGVKYVTGTFKGTDSLSIDDSVEGVLTFTPVEDKIKPNTEYEFTYETELTDKILLDQWASKNPTSHTFKNKITGKQADDTEIAGLSASGSATLSSAWSGWKLVAKTGKLEWDGDQPYVNWTVTVNTVSRQFVSLTVKDTLGKGLTLNGGIKIDDTAATYGIAPDTDGKTIVTIPLIKKADNGSAQTALSTYKITYRTDVDKDYFSQAGADIPTDDDVSNNATLEWAWPTGKGPGADYEIPTIDKKPGDVDGFHDDMVKKDGGTYNAAERALNWTVTVNPNRVDLKEITLVEELDQTPNEHTFDRTKVGSSEAIALKDAVDAIQTAIQAKLPADATVSVTADADTPNKKLTIRIEKLGKKECTFTFQSYVSDPAIWADNTSKSFHNKVTVTNAVTTDGQKVGEGAGLMADANETVNLEVLKKEVSTYDAANQEIVWRLKVNHNATPLSDIVITETLPAGLTYVDGSAKIGAPYTEEKDMPALAGVSSSDGKVIFTVPNQTPPAEQWLLFRTKMDVNAKAYENAETVTYQNHISMTNGEGTTPEANCDFTLVNNPLTKTSVGEGNEINYTVSLNPLGVDLLKTMEGATLYMKDQLGDCLFLDVDSVKIAEAKPTANKENGSYRVTLEPIGEWQSVTDVVYDTAENFFQIEIPNAAKPYVITYTAYATRGGDLTNTVSLVGSKLPLDSNLKSERNTFQLIASAGARLRLPAGKFLSFSVKKTDENNNLLKSGVTAFGVYTDAATQNLITSGKVNAESGYCELGLPASAVTGIDTLYLKELAAPAGYVISPAAIKISVKDIQAATGADGYVETVKNVKSGQEIGGSLTLHKKDNKNNNMAGVTFGLYQDADAQTPVMKDGVAVTGVTDAGGKLTFNGLYPGSTYYAKELSTLETHVLDATPHQVKANGTDISITNQKAEAAIKITKVRDGNDAIKLPGAKFKLFSDENGITQKGAEQTTDANGVAEFKDLQPNTVYYLKETAPPTGYNENDNLTLGQMIEVKTGENDATKPVEMTVTNKKILVSIEVTKVREGKEDTKLSGAGFELYSDRAGNNRVRAEQKTDADGVTTFTKLEPKTTYYLKETVTPTGYKTPQNVWTEVTTKDFTESIPKAVKIANEKILVSLHVIKEGDGATGPRLPGAKLALYEADKATLVHTAQTTDANGETTFTKLEPETTYYIRETEAPKGYRIKNEWTEVKTGAFDAAKPADATVVNEKILVGIRVIKVREGDPDTKLEDAKFELYSDAEGKNLMRAEQATDGNGITEFTGLQPETTYYLKETEAPSGYRILTDGLIEIKTGAGVEGAQPVEQTVENARRRSSSSSRPKPPTEEPPEPVVPVGPIDPADPNPPVDPDHPAGPDDPSNPSNPADPSDPAKPGGTDDPTDSNDPGHPDAGDGTVTVPSGSTASGASGTGSFSGNRISSIPETGVQDRIPLWALGLACSLGLAAVLCLSQFISRPKGKHMKKRG